MKRFLDIIFSLMMLLIFGWVILFSFIVASFDTGSYGFFIQSRVGQYGKTFNIFKIRTISEKSFKISKLGMFLRRSKIDELPQLLNVLIGQMSIVGPRPDIPGYYDNLNGEDRKILELKPGLTSEASLKYYNEESILKNKPNPLEYNDMVIFPDKVKMNLEYYNKQSFGKDLKIILKTFLRFFKK